MTLDEEAPVSDWALERYALGELPAPQAAWIEALLPSRPDLAARLEALRSSNEAILRRYPPRVVAAQVGGRVQTERRRWQFGAMGLALAAVATVAVVVTSVEPPQEMTERTKGLGATLRVFRQVRGGSERLGQGSRVVPGDVVQLTFAPGVATDAVLVSIDGRGAVTRHHPPAGESTRVSGSNVVVGHGFALNDAPAFERFFLVTALRPIDVEAVVTAAGELAKSPNAGTDPLVLGSGLDSLDLTLQKEAR